MFIYRFFMPDGDGDAGGNMGGEAAVPDAPVEQAPDVAPDEGTETGTVTADDVAEVMGLPKPEAQEEEDVPDEEEEAADEDPAGDAGGEEGADTEDPAPDTPAPADVDENKSADVPGDETPDFSFTVEDADGVTFKVSPGDDIDTTLAKFNPTGTGQLINIMRQLEAAEGKQRQYESDMKADAEQKERDASIARIQEGWDNEIKTLVADKRLEATADVNNSERVKQVFAYMQEENAKRAEDGRPQIASFEDALDKLELRESREEKSQAKSAAKETARKNGSLVGGGSAKAGGGGPRYVAGQATNAGEALRILGY